MKKLLLVSGIFLGLGLAANAQEKKAVTATTTTTTTTHEMQKKKTLKDMKAERNAARLKKAEARKKGNTAPGAAEKKETAN